MPSSTSESRSLAVPTALVVLLIAGGGALALGYCRDDRAATPPAAVPEPEPAPALPTLPSVAPATGETPPGPAVPPAKPGDVPRASNGQPLGKAKFPDGSFQIALNDVTEDLEIVWDDRRPYSPVTHTEFNNGFWYWRHADGTFSSTRYIEVNGVRQASWMTDLITTDNVLPINDGKNPPGPIRPSAQQPGGGNR